MTVILEFPEKLEKQLKTALGDDLARAAKEALAIEAYRSGMLSLGKIAELLDIAVSEADRFFKERGVALPYSLADFESDRKSLKEFLRG